jgi:hypothetical protein
VRWGCRLSVFAAARTLNQVATLLSQPKCETVISRKSKVLARVMNLDALIGRNSNSFVKMNVPEALDHCASRCSCDHMISHFLHGSYCFSFLDKKRSRDN